MKRAIIAASATVAGLAGVFSFHTSTPKLSFGATVLPGSLGGTTTSTTTGGTITTTSSPGRSVTTTTVRGTVPTSTPTTRPTTSPSGHPTTTQPGTPTTVPTHSTTTTAPPVTTTTAAPPPPTTTTAPPSQRRTATGTAVNYDYGSIAVQVTAVGSKITNVSVASLDDGGNYRSISIDQMAIPILEQEALAAQSANIQSVSGASYTSWGFAQSLQSALSQLNL